MNAGTTAERVYDRLKREMACGSLSPGARLEPARLAQEFNSSPTPIRDALHRLAGERLVETRASDGFHVPAVTEIGLRDLYRWNDELVRTALRVSQEPCRQAGPLVEPVDAADLFAFIAARSRSAEIVTQVALANDRLAYIRQIESNIVANSLDEIRAINTALLQSSKSTKNLIQEYHRSRISIIPRLISHIFQNSSSLR
ncbi:GntR family transcriptional regulator [Novosphingobium sp. KA1]|uniref:GntR family transcriptional regulator n=1 Tax=Novosphingobium sp. (strain KA1) TaxID=164608 RepID=UPI001A8E9051|nr:GntR family transcriptional regulator [Novosphingobium sp. KA1]